MTGSLAYVGVRGRVAWLLVMAAFAFALLAALAALGDMVSIVVHVAGAPTARLGPAGAAIFVAGSLLFLGLMLAGVVAARSRLTDLQLLLVGLAILLVIRLAVVLIMDSPVSIDASAYRKLALKIMDRGFFFTDARPTGYPYLLALAYGALGRSPLTHELLNLGFVMAGGALLFDLAHRLAGRTGGMLALIAYAATPGLLLLTTVRLVDSIFATLLIAVCWAAARASTGNVLWAAVAGALIGASQYIRPIGPVILAAVLLATLLFSASWRRAAQSVGLLVAACLVVLLPVFAHNLDRHGELSPSPSYDWGWSLYVGTNQASNGRWNWADFWTVHSLPGENYWEQTAEAMPLGLQRITDDPVGFAGLAVRKFAVMWGTQDYAVEFGLNYDLKGASPLGAQAGVDLVAQLVYLAMLCAVAAGLLIVLRARMVDPALLVAVCIVLAEAAMHIFLEVKPRYHAHLEPILLLLSAPALARLAAAMRLPDLPLISPRAASAGELPAQQAHQALSGREVAR